MAYTVYDNPPEVARSLQLWRPGTGQDAARALIPLGSVKAPGQHSAGQLRHARPYLVSGSQIFVWPGGTEGFRAYGRATLAIHHYIGDNSVDAFVIHSDEGRIDLSGTFAGISSQDNMVNLRQLLIGFSQEQGQTLYVPGVFEREQYVVPEEYDFTHTEDDRSASIGYSVTFLRIGVRGKITDKPGTAPAQNPGSSTAKGTPSRFFTVSAGAETLRQIAAIVYGDADQWTRLVDLNKDVLSYNQATSLLSSVNGIPNYQLPTARFAIGTKIAY